MYRTLVSRVLLISFVFFSTGCQYLQQMTPPVTEPPMAREEEPSEPAMPVPPPDKPVAVEKEPPPIAVPESVETIAPPELPEVTEKQAPEKPSDLAIIISYFRFLNALPQQAIKQERQRTRQEFDEDQSPVNRLRLAMVLGLKNHDPKNTSRSLSLLEGISKDPDQDPMLSDFSFLLFTMIQKLKNDARHRQDLSQKLREKSNENKTLKKMIEELKAIEKNIMEREHPG